MCILYCIQFMDKATLASSSILGILYALRSWRNARLTLRPGKLLTLTRINTIG
ncbi:hypothetical protein BJV77DRAFT_1006890 [Russula vinacea]|nr:hypothetical protein BJV77DRAFT_1006890 [Russula vinacea]